MNRNGIAEGRQQAVSSPVLTQVAVWLVAILVPVALTLTAIRALMTPAFLQFEYNTPGFPADPYGFTTQDRLYWSRFAVDYLLNDAGISYLGDLRFENGDPVYNERELRHMVDVKNAIRITIAVWAISLILLVGLGLWAWAGGWLDSYRAGLVRGGWLTVILLAVILALVVVAFGVFFVAFHNVFFQPGTWTFLWSDTLIRLFPERFWRDIFLYVGGFAILGGLILALGLPRIWKG
jgi:integral membrane protein (TIGR01906 family)